MGFSALESLILQFCHNFGEVGPSSENFLTKMGPLSKEFW